MMKVFSMNNTAVIDLCESLLHLLDPVKWESIYIPFLPFHLVSSLEAIQGYLIGMSSIHMDYVPPLHAGHRPLPAQTTRFGSFRP